MATPQIFGPLRWGTNLVSGGQRLAHNRYTILSTGLANHTKRILDPRGPFLNWILLAVCIISTSSDPLFFYIFVVNDTKKCVRLDKILAIIAISLRTVLDFLHILYSTFKPDTDKCGRNTLDRHGRANARKYCLLSSFLKELLSCLPAPQVMTLVIILSTRVSEFFSIMVSLKVIVIVQYMPRFVRIYKVYVEAERTSGILAQVKWVKASCCILIYLLAAHVFGALWYLLAIERETECWKKACIDDTRCHHSSFQCYETFGDYTFLNEFCPTIIQNSMMYNFGIFQDAVQSGIVQEETDFIKKFIYCFRWGLQTISCVGQNLQTSTNVGENFLVTSIIIFSWLLIILVLGTLQIYMQFGTMEVEETRFRARAIEQWRNFSMLSQNLQALVKNHQQMVWQESRGVDIENLLNNLPSYLSRDIKSELCLEMLKKVAMFQRMEEELLNEICNCLKPVLYAEDYCIIKEGEPIGEMLFIMQGTLSTTTTINDGNSCLFKGYLSNGDFWGEELPIYVLDPQLSRLPCSSVTVRSVTRFEAFALKDNYLKEVVYKFWQNRNMELNHIFRFYSPKWRTRQAGVIQVAWRRHKKKKLKRYPQSEEVNRLQDGSGEAGENLLSILRINFYVAQFSARALSIVQRNSALNSGNDVEEVKIE